MVFLYALLGLAFLIAAFVASFSIRSDIQIILVVQFFGFAMTFFGIAALRPPRDRTRDRPKIKVDPEF